MVHHARKRFGQHFLHDEVVIQKIVDAINPHEDIPITEIGPGYGALTIPLLYASGTLDALEIDRNLAKTLNEKCSKIGLLNLHIEDALKFDFTKLDGKKIKIVGNLPYNISTPLLFHLLSQLDQIHTMVFMMQKEVVDRICAETSTKQYGRLSMMVQSQCAVEKLLHIGPEAFTPPPKIESSVIRLKPLVDHQHIITDTKLFARIVKLAFAQRRKTIRNSLKDLVGLGLMERLDIASTNRAENLSCVDYINITNALQSVQNK